jgi:hypothetical protein
LLEQLSLLGLDVRRVGLGTVGEDGLGALEQVFLPAVDERGVDAELTSQFVDGPIPP